MPNNVGNGVSGQFGDAKTGSGQISEVRKWTFNPKANNVRYASNKTQGYKKVVVGIAEASGTLTCVWDPTSSTILANPGILTPNQGLPNFSGAAPTPLTLNLYLSLTAYYSVYAFIDSNTINMDIDTGEIVSIDVAFSATGKWDQPTVGLALAEGFDIDEYLFVPADGELRELDAGQLDELAQRDSKYRDLDLDYRPTVPLTGEDAFAALRRQEADAFAALAAQTVLDYQRRLPAQVRREMRLYGHSEAVLVPRGCGREPAVIGTR